MTYCEDYPCCGHTPADPCARQEYDEPGYYDTSVAGQEHRLCNHEEGECNVEYYIEEPEEELEVSSEDDGLSEYGDLPRVGDRTSLEDGQIRECRTKTPEPHRIGEFPMTCHDCHMFADA